jgi:hypothetical protein
MKINKCVKCNNKTHQVDGVCVVCRINIPQMFAELVDLLKKDNTRDYRLLKIAGRR